MCTGGYFPRSKAAEA